MGSSCIRIAMDEMTWIITRILGAGAYR